MSDADAGLFGPDSVAWRLHADPAMLVAGDAGAARAGLEPRAMAGVDQHSKYREDPWGRLERTTDFVYDTTYGDTEAAERHARGCAGCTGGSMASIRSPAGSTRRPIPTSLLWIHAVEVHSFVAGYRAYAGRVSDEDADRYVAEMARVAELVELPAGMAPSTFGELREYLHGVGRSPVTDGGA